MLFYASNNCSLSKCYSNLAKYNKSTVKQRKTTSIQVQKILKITDSTVCYREFATNANKYATMLFYASNNCSLSKCYSNLAKYNKKYSQTTKNN